MSKIKCGFCGKENDSNSKFCQYCGNKLKDKGILTKLKELFSFNKSPKNYYKDFLANKTDIEAACEFFNNQEYIDKKTKKNYKKNNRFNFQICSKLLGFHKESKIKLKKTDLDLINDFVKKYENINSEVKKINKKHIEKEHNKFKENKERYQELIDKYKNDISYDSYITEDIKINYKKDFKLINKLLGYASSDNFDFGEDKIVFKDFKEIYKNFDEIKRDINDEVGRRKSLLNDLKKNKNDILDFINLYKNDVHDNLFIKDYQIILSENKQVLELCKKINEINDCGCCRDFIKLYDDFPNVANSINKNYFNRKLDIFLENKEDLLIQIDVYSDLNCEIYLSNKETFLSKYSEIYLVLKEIITIHDNFGYKIEDNDFEIILSFMDTYENFNGEFPYSVYSDFTAIFAKVESFVSKYKKVKDCNNYIWDKDHILRDFEGYTDIIDDVLLLDGKNEIELTRIEQKRCERFKEIYFDFDGYVLKHNKCHVKQVNDKFNRNKEIILDFTNNYNLNSSFNYYINDNIKNNLLKSNRDNYDLVCHMCELTEIPTTDLMVDFIGTYENFDEIVFNINKKFVLKQYDEYEGSISKYSNIMNLKQDYYISHSDVGKLEDGYDELLIIVNNLLNYCSQYDYLDDLNTLKSFPKSFNELTNSVNSANEAYIERELNDNEHFFENVVPGKSLDSNQRRAAIVDEDNTQIIAGAGCGKTLTLQAKAKYLIENKNIKPDEILAISFSKLSTNDLTRKMQEIGLDIDTSTFHALGLKTLRENNINAKVLDYGLNNAIKKYFAKKIINNSEKIRKVLEFLAYYLYTPPDKEKIKKIGEAYDQERGMDLETFYSKFAKLKDPTLKKTTLHGEIVKSLEERKVANFLFINGINYSYEKEWNPKYDWDKYYNFLDKYVIFDSDIPQKLKKDMLKELLQSFEIDEKICWRTGDEVVSYHPDFYLDDYDIYYEHFGVNRKCIAPWLPKRKSVEYGRSVKNKRILHKKYGTKLIETYSYYQSENRLLKRLSEKLQESGVSFNPIDYKELLINLIQSEEKINEYWDFIKLVGTFINLFKGNGYGKDKFEEFRKINSQFPDGIKERHEIFLDIVEDIYDYYNEYLKEHNAIDFNDMINDATDLIKENGFYKNYKYILVDEFQDTSHTRFEFLKALKNTLNAKLIVVGDDWQSIYRFTGCDVDLFTNFSDYFDDSKTEICYITNTYRNSQNLIDVSGNFIMKNEAQIKKQLKSKSANQIKDCIKLYQYYNSLMQPYVFEKMINDIFEYSNKDHVKILVLGRNRKDFNRIINENLFFTTGSVEDKNLKIHYRKNPRIYIDYMTVHGSKGLEADNVILINLEDEKNGFPNKIEDDSVLTFVKNNNDESIDYAEERRLFYVALTRTKERTFLLASKDKKSVFVKELMEDIEVIDAEKDIEVEELDEKIHVIASTDANCPYCGTGKINLKFNPKTGKRFFNCSNWSMCDWFGGLFYGDVSELDNPQFCPKCGGLLVKKMNHRTGEYFYSCINYFPNKDCRYSKNI